MNVFVFGANGMAGHMIAVYFMERGHNVTGFVRKKNNFCHCIEGNALDRDTVQAVLKNGYYDAVINCIGVLNQAVDANLTDGIYLNSVLPHFIADCIKDMETRFIHVSSDCVFTGNRGHYTEDSIKDAESNYGRSKALGEVTYGKNLTFRTSIVGPEMKPDGIGLFHWFMSQNGFVNGFNKVIWNGITTLQLAKGIEAALEQKLTGLYHLVNNETITKYELLHLFNKHVNESKTKIYENNSFCNDKSLINTKKDFNFQIPDYDTMIREMADWMRMHKELYR